MEWALYLPEKMESGVGAMRLVVPGRDTAGLSRGYSRCLTLEPWESELDQE